MQELLELGWNVCVVGLLFIHTWKIRRLNYRADMQAKGIRDTVAFVCQGEQIRKMPGNIKQ